MLCVIAKIDETARQRLHLLQKIAEKQGVPLRHLHGHITLAAYSGIGEAVFRASCKKIFQEYRPFSIRYDHLRILREPSTIVACSPCEGVLADIQRRIVDEWADELHIWSQPGIWLPHTTLVQDSQADLDAVLAAMKIDFQPFEALISAIEFSAVRENGYEIIDVAELNG